MIRGDRFRTCLLLTVVAFPWPSRADPPPPDSLPLESFNVARGGTELLLLPIEIADRSVRGVLDTGTEITIYDSSLQSLLGNLQGIMAIDTPQGQHYLNCFLAPKPIIGALRLVHDSEGVVCADLANLRRATKQDVRAVIGMDLLRRSVVRIDVEQGVVQFLRNARLASEKGIPMKGEMPAPTIAATLEGLGFRRFVIDTGLVGPASNMLDEGTFGALLRNGCMSLERDVLNAGLSRTDRRRSGRLRTEIALGNMRDRGIRFTEGTANLLGMEYLSRFDVTFDFPGHVLHLERHRRSPLGCGASHTRSVGATKRGQVNGLAPKEPSGRRGLK